MEDALEVYRRRRVDVVWAQTEYGPQLRHQDPRFPRFLCPLCLAGLHVVRPAPENGTPILHTTMARSVTRSRRVGFVMLSCVTTASRTTSSD